jgi:hypothetical protein
MRRYVVFLGVDAYDFQHRLEDAASSIQHVFRKATRKVIEEAGVATITMCANKTEDCADDLERENEEDEADGMRKEEDTEEEGPNLAERLMLFFVLVFSCGMLIYRKVLEYCAKEKHDNINEEQEELDGRAQQSSGQTTAGQGGTGAGQANGQVASQQGVSQAAVGQGAANGAGHVGAEAALQQPPP